MMSESVVSILNLHLRFKDKIVLDNLSWNIVRGQNWVLNGISGSGKTSLAQLIETPKGIDGSIEYNFDKNSILPQQVLYVSNWYHFRNLEGDANFYYQQRYNRKQARETLTVEGDFKVFGKEKHLHLADADKIIDALGYRELLDSQLIELSSGEHKKLQLIKALWLKPQLLILDQPYAGLDVASRKNLNTLLEEFSSQGAQYILITNDSGVPGNVHMYARIIDGQLVTSATNEHSSEILHELAPLPAFLTEKPVYHADQVVKMSGMNIHYGEKQVLNNINWEVKAGEKWLLQGHNGSGKSTLLSLVCADHPQSYVDGLFLFGKQRGSGESIWEIKEKIGLISPELHWYFDPAATVFTSIASGFYDSIGLFKQLPYSQTLKVREIIDFLHLKEVQHELLNTLPLGKQRLALLARAIIKNPELLILDEPCQGLDNDQTQYFNKFVDKLCANGTTLIYVGHYESALPSCLEKRILLDKGHVVKIETIQ
ncbi:ATP-binding cassette domain-containing protein [Chitinophaga sancti]|uniref:ATP-binding cassette domain-containing protein n=1 Tax=Chitinophaga sancti TaxID=1004 RepID=A0A1K1SWE2_9BACT|nr:ATP-binding cassette domain-containing protein [Chitinophaga sancti]WQD63808.1 ATP-binding cassette domain-containing protein [Chitinophaga sancti]WQG90567.1 ATP-binding cassette domain-containing protein [Chitinophaga sancti]SFW88181.1 molybdate transport system ATP-binding protein [Chitinophaga sancti]